MLRPPPAPPIHPAASPLVDGVALRLRLPAEQALCGDALPIGARMQVKSRTSPMIRHSGFGFLSDFGFRTSDFGLKQLRPDSAFITMGGTGHWPVPSGDPPDGTGEALFLPADTNRHGCFVMLSSFHLRHSQTETC